MTTYEDSAEAALDASIARTRRLLASAAALVVGLVATWWLR